MAADTLPDNPRYCFCPIEDAEVGVQQIRIVVEGMDVTIGTSLVTLAEGEALSVADKLNQQLGWTPATWTAFAAKCLRGGCGGDDSAPD